MKYEISIENKAFNLNQLDGLKWENLHYPPESTNIERIEIDQFINEKARGKSIMIGIYKYGKYDYILDQTNVDRQNSLYRTTQKIHYMANPTYVIRNNSKHFNI